MRRFAAILGLLVASMAVLPPVALASHSMTGGAECGSRSFDGVADMTKGRTDGMVVTASYATGCKSYSYRNLIGTGLDEAYGYSGQQENCIRVGQTDVANFYRYYFDTEINPSDVKVSCSAYAGPD
jgi:hypothetical protein